MPDMTEPYAYIKNEIEKLECKAQQAQEESRAMTSLALAYRESALSLSFALRCQCKQDKEDAQEV